MKPHIQLYVQCFITALVKEYLLPNEVGHSRTRYSKSVILHGRQIETNDIFTSAVSRTAMKMRAGLC